MGSVIVLHTQFAASKLKAIMESTYRLSELNSGNQPDDQVLEQLGYTVLWPVFNCRMLEYSTISIFACCKNYGIMLVVNFSFHDPKECLTWSECRGLLLSDGLLVAN